MVVIMLALSIGANTATFPAANDFLLRPMLIGNSYRAVIVSGRIKNLQPGWFDPLSEISPKEKSISSKIWPLGMKRPTTLP